MVKAIFFDVDDTMYDHLLPFKKAIQPAVVGIEHFPYEEAYHRMRYYSDKLSIENGGAEHMALHGLDKKMQIERFQYCLADFNISISFEQASDIQQNYLATQFNIELFSGMSQLLNTLIEQGMIIGLLTNGEKTHQTKKIKALQLETFINKDNIYISGAYGKDKPDPFLFNLIANKLQLKPEQCLYVGDSWRNDVIGATNANWNVIWFNHRNVVCPNSEQSMTEVNSVEELTHYIKSNYIINSVI